MSKIILLGYMGSGKTIVANEFYKKGYKNVFDLDFIIEKELKMSVNEVFKTKGEVFFRKKEHQILNEFLETHDDFVLSLGGGTPCYANNHLLLTKEGVESIYLKASVKTLVNRLKKNYEKRPLLQNLEEDDLNDFIAKHLFDRSYFYYQAKHIISVDKKTVSEIVSEIESLLA